MTETKLSKELQDEVDLDFNSIATYYGIPIGVNMGNKLRFPLEKYALRLQEAETKIDLMVEERLQGATKYLELSHEFCELKEELLEERAKVAKLVEALKSVNEKCGKFDLGYTENCIPANTLISDIFLTTDKALKEIEGE